MSFILKGKKEGIVNVKWNPDKEMKSRGITMSSHEVCKFSYNKNRGFPEQRFSNLIHVYKSKVQEDNQDDEESKSHSDSSFNSQEEEDLDYELREVN